MKTLWSTSEAQVKRNQKKKQKKQKKKEPVVHFRGTGTSEKNIEKNRKNRKNKEPVVLFTEAQVHTLLVQKYKY